MTMTMHLMTSTAFYFLLQMGLFVLIRSKTFCKWQKVTCTALLFSEYKKQGEKRAQQDAASDESASPVSGQVSAVFLYPFLWKIIKVGLLLFTVLLQGLCWCGRPPSFIVQQKNKGKRERSQAFPFTSRQLLLNSDPLSLKSDAAGAQRVNQSSQVNIDFHLFSRKEPKEYLNYLYKLAVFTTFLHHSIVLVGWGPCCAPVPVCMCRITEVMLSPEAGASGSVKESLYCLKAEVNEAL